MQLAYAGLNTIAVSIDGLRESHNRFRKSESFDRAFEGGLDPDNGERKTVDIVEACRMFPDEEWFEKIRKEWGLFAEGTYENRYGNCHAYMRKGEKYCRKCGTEKGKGAFLPFKNNSYAVYGPPIKQKFKCKACGHLWSTEILGGAPDGGTARDSCAGQRDDDQGNGSRRS